MGKFENRVDVWGLAYRFLWELKGRRLRMCRVRAVVLKRYRFLLGGVDLEGEIVFGKFVGEGREGSKLWELRIL